MSDPLTDQPLTDPLHAHQPIVGTHGGSQDGPTRDADGTPLAAGDHVTLIEQHDPAYRYYLGKHAVVEWVQEVFPFSQVFLVLPDHPDLPALSTFSCNVRKEGSGAADAEAGAADSGKAGQ